MNMIVENGKNLVRDLLCGATAGVSVDKAGLGTVSTSVSESDTGLNGNSNFGVADSVNDISYTTSKEMVVFDYNLGTTESTAVTFKEFGLNQGSAILFNRQTFYDLTHESTEEWQISIAVKVV